MHKVFEFIRNPINRNLFGEFINNLGLVNTAVEVGVNKGYNANELMTRSCYFPRQSAGVSTFLVCTETKE